MIQRSLTHSTQCAAITISTQIQDENVRPVQPRALGNGILSVIADETGKTRIVNLRQAGATKLVFPVQPTPQLEAILINTAGGVTGGDVFGLDITAGEGSQLTMTTQAAERAYRAQPDEVGQITTHLSIKSGARLDWLPQEMILFDRCALRRRLEIDLDHDAQLLMVEPVVFGRIAMEETLNNIDFHDRIAIRRSGTPLYLDAVHLTGDISKRLTRRAIAAGARAIANIVAVQPNLEHALPKIRATLPATAGASLLAEDVLVIRHLAEDSFALRRDLIPVLEMLSARNLPTSWRL